MKINYDYDEAALALGIGVDFLQANIDSLPHRGYGRRVLFSEADLHVINEMHFVAPGEREQRQQGEKKRPAKPTTRTAPKPAASSNPLHALRPRGASKKAG